MKSYHCLFRLIIIVLLCSDGLHACSIIGHLGNGQCKSVVLRGLERLEYRGYDSAGFAWLAPDGDELCAVKTVGKLQNLKDALAHDERLGHVGIGHTRWATHGPATKENAHPHYDTHKTIAVVHNGIIENHVQVREDLIKSGAQFRSQTDTEVIPHALCEALKSSANIKEAVLKTVQQLDGAYGCIAIMKEHSGVMIAIRKSSPICIGVNEHEKFVASDFLAFAGHTDTVCFLPDESFALITKDEIQLYDFAGNELPIKLETMNIEPSVYENTEHDHFMLKEIYEQKKVVSELVDYYQQLGDDIWQLLGINKQQVRNIKRIALFGCGTSWHAARIAQFFFELVTNVPVRVYLASEFRYMPFFPEEDILYISVSQSGETADTLEAIRLINKHNMPVITITNVPSSTMVRETCGHLPLKAGPEIAVASTKAFTSQIASLYWLAHRFACERGTIGATQLQQAGDNLVHAAHVLELAIDRYGMDIIQKHAPIYCTAERFMYLGRHTCYPFAMEGALKLKEISYIFAQGYPAGELKHGSIALIDVETPVVLFSHLDETIYKKILGNANEVKARKGHLVAFAFEGQHELINLADVVFEIPRVAPLLEPLAMAGLMQFMAYQIAKELGCDIDKPRNLAKSVTVE